MSLRVTLATTGVFVGCCSGIVFLELLVKLDPGAGNLITAAQFAFIALEGFIFTAKLGRAKRIISLKDYALLVIMFFMTSVCNNYVFKFNVPLTLHMIIRGGSLISNMCLGTLILKRQYRISQYIAVIMISLGIFICTYFSSRQLRNDSYSTEEADMFWWFVGVLLLVLALFVSSYMGITQELLYRRHGKQGREALYYTHLLPLPFFLLLHDNITKHWSLAFESPAYRLPLLGVAVPLMLLYLLGNVLAQYLCISSVYTLTTECTSLTVTLILTLRKFVSLLFSILYFRNPFTLYHWAGTLLVFVGTLMFSNVLSWRSTKVNTVKNK
ncbi:UDP-xylose and UDP-N-acetylglucosamine transporter [Scaptodrosophila lebanonensis]|uniref:UDP-xylose and UDP-N-acetylglucosamine transporter n=1 Tax=Drosophila lebanonensis TaxID=7225 RepID=A0A6J2T6F3_DROLE|nr:UDP-xylose and UDP-N-acetylglucosamine transporter [Scaptodrosophila lebanonensis]